ncbi:hypothetical protein [Caldicellulosiruptor morganii]|uniref:4Fe-4S ferredoxin-type domain-containing protein n=1 Tax=Caldicellulosiruptor morganii TaxID=1387555 RepID=A0ABY7BNM9_9FIRM|nr:hypothetical protein [Caldicellulosiruptor morganii]WAM32994.1 hypothetical protein OTK00_001453 [Caldicellulosiruptor morganii]
MKVKCPVCGYEVDVASNKKCPRCNTPVVDFLKCTGNCKTCKKSCHIKY